MKEQYMEAANEIAWEIFEKEFYDLTKDQQDKVWSMAERNVVDNLAGRADHLRKEKKEENNGSC
jgi:hypothetical protein